MRIAVDLTGGDHAPLAPLHGARTFLEADARKSEVILLGSAAMRERFQAELARWPKGWRWQAVEQVISGEEAPVMAIRRKRDSAVVRGLKMVRDGEADAMVSAGSTGALMAGALLILGRLPGVDRPALGSFFPCLDGRQTLVLDLGANVDVNVHNLKEFAVMGSVYAAEILGLETPRVGLLNIGTEPSKGNELTKSAYHALASSSINFVGNVEARDLLTAAADVVVCDGFTGNIALKSLEGASSLFTDMLRRETRTGVRAMLGGLLLRPALKKSLQRLDYRETGGAALLGLNGVCVKCHGSSNARAFARGLTVAQETVQRKIPEKISTSLQHGNAKPLKKGEAQ